MACFDLGRVQRARGRLGAPLATCQHLVENTAPPGRAAMPSAGIGYVGMAEVAYQRGELDSAAACHQGVSDWLAATVPAPGASPASRARRHVSATGADADSTGHVHFRVTTAAGGPHTVLA
jgi:hypothetical protein